MAELIKYRGRVITNENIVYIKELIAAHPATAAECAIEFESSTGSKVRIQWKGSSTPDWSNLFRGWRESER